MRILVVEDSERLRRYLERGLQRSGYAVDMASDGENALWLIDSNDYDVIVLDRMLPNLNGDTVLERLPGMGCESPVLILSARDSVGDRVSGLRKGASDYLIKPFAFEELLARIQNLVRRRYGSSATKIEIGDLTLDTVRKEICRGGERISLRPREYVLLEYLAFRQGQLVSRTEIESHIYDDHVEPMSNVVDAAVYSLRKKIDLPNRPSLITTRRGLGYVLEPSDEIHSG